MPHRGGTRPDRALTLGSASSFETPDSVYRPDLAVVLRRLHGTRSGVILAAAATRLDLEPKPPTDAELSIGFAPYLWFLNRIGPKGLTLTAHGYMHMVDTVAAAEVIPEMHGWVGKTSREVAALPILEFREIMRHLGLARKVHNRFVRTQRGDAVLADPAVLWDRLAERLPLGSPDSIANVAGLMSLYLAATSPAQPVDYQLLAHALTDLGWTQRDGRPISSGNAASAARGTVKVLGTVDFDPQRGLPPTAISPLASRLAHAVIAAR